MDLNDAISAHIKWKIRLLQCIHGQAEPPEASEVERDDACELGRWLSGEGAGYSQLATFQETKAAHAVFHVRAAEVVRALETGDKRLAESMLRLGGEFSVASEAVVYALTKLRAEVRKRGGQTLQA